LIIIIFFPNFKRGHQRFFADALFVLKITCRFDPRGNFVINVEGGKIKAKQLSPSGKPIFEI